MPKGRPKNPIPCTYCGTLFFRTGPRQKFCLDPRCKLLTYTDKTPGQGPQGDCWEWTRNKDRGGYGRVRWKGKDGALAARTIYEVFVGPIPDGQVVRHTCDHPPCVNPNHLISGTQKDNAKDREKRGRGNQPKGERQAMAELTDDKVIEIRSRYAEGGISQESLGVKFGVSQNTISKIVRKKNWGHIQ